MDNINNKYFCLFGDDQKDNRVELFNKINGYAGTIKTNIYYNDAYIGASSDGVFIPKNSYCGSVRSGRFTDDLFTNCTLKRVLPYKNVMYFACKEGIISSTDIELTQDKLNEIMGFFKEYFGLSKYDNTPTDVKQRR